MAAKVTSKGQITIPLEVRERLGLRPGDRVVFRLGAPPDQHQPVTLKPERGGPEASLAPIPDLVSLAGTMPPPAGRRGRPWAEVRAHAWDEELRTRR